MVSSISIDQALCDPRLLGAALGDIASWRAWRVALRATFGLQLSHDDAQLFAEIAGNRNPPTKRVRELWAIVGRRGGKSRVAAALAVYLALFVEHKVAAGEQPMVLVIAGSKDQARTVFGYIKGFLDASPALRAEVTTPALLKFRRSELELRNGVVIAVHSNSFRTVRGRTLCAAIFDEVAFWRDESSATPDIEVYRAVLPSLATTNGLLVGISTPYRKLGLLHQKFRDHFGVDDPEVLVVKGASKLFNPSLSDDTIAAQRSADLTAAAAEWDAEFRTDISAFLDDELIEEAVEYGRPLELPPNPTTYYRAFCDASGGTGADSYTLAIAHKEHERIVVDVVRGTVGKFDPQEVTKQYTALLKEYRVSTVTGDNYAAQWVAGAWRDTGISYVKSDLPKSQLYLECIPLFTRGLVQLPDHSRLLRELRLLERHIHRSGKDTVDHPRNGNDDHANAVCGVLRGFSQHRYTLEPFAPDFVDLDAPPPTEQRPEPLRCNGDWWKGVPRQPPTFSADDNLRSFYSSLAQGFRTG